LPPFPAAEAVILAPFVSVSVEVDDTEISPPLAALAVTEMSPPLASVTSPASIVTEPAAPVAPGSAEARIAGSEGCAGAIDEELADLHRNVAARPRRVGRCGHLAAAGDVQEAGLHLHIPPPFRSP